MKKTINYIISGKGRIYFLLKKIIPWSNPIFNWIRFLYLKKKYNFAKDFSVKSYEKKSSDINKNEFSLFSQHGEDGIFNFIFEQIGFSNKKSVEIGFGYHENNSLFLISKFHFKSLLIDGQDYNVNVFNDFNKKYIKSESLAIKKWITKDNINDIISSYVSDKEIDLLSIDIDGNDYWIWKAINCVSPRVVILEYNASLHLHSLTVPYNESFDRTDYSNNPRHSHWYHGASLSALAKLSKTKGYELIGTDKKGVNAFFVRKDLIIENGLDILTVSEAYKPHFGRTNGILTKVPLDSEHQFKEIEYLKYIKV
jgi:hypothetical protein